MNMEPIICPIDGKPCEETCPDRYKDRAEGGCFMTTFIEVCGPDSVIIMRSKRRGEETMSKHSFHGARSAKKMLAHGVQQGIGVFGRQQPRKKPKDNADSKKQTND